MGKLRHKLSTNLGFSRVALAEHLVSLGDDVQVKPTKLYMAYRRLKNFACVHRAAAQIRIWLKVEPESVALEAGFSRDVRGVGHWCTGDVEVVLKSLEDLGRAKHLLQRSYDDN